MNFVAFMKTLKLRKNQHKMINVYHVKIIKSLNNVVNMIMYIINSNNKVIRVYIKSEHYVKLLVLILVKTKKFLMVRINKKRKKYNMKCILMFARTFGPVLKVKYKKSS